MIRPQGFPTESFRTVGQGSGLWSQFPLYLVASRFSRYPPIVFELKGQNPMRPIHLLLGLVLVLACAASAYVATRMAMTPEPAHTDVQATQTSASPVVEASNLELRKTQDRLAMLAADFDRLSSELETLRTAANRAPVATNSVQPPQAEQLGTVAVTDIQRQAVLAVLAEDRARQAAEAEAARVKAEQEVAQRRAARIAKDLNLSPGDETRLADLMVESGKKRQEMFDSMRNGNFDRDTMRTQFESMKTAYNGQLTQAFGASIAEQIMQAEGDRMFAGGPGGGPGGAFGGGGGNGGQTRGARRQNGQGGIGGTGAPGGGQQQN